VFVDTSTIPMAALERVEILKEGATATYGSDAVAGVANFILRKDVEGIEISTGYEEITDGGAGKYDVNFLAGFGNDTTRVTVAGTMIKQDSLSSAERPYTTENAFSTLGRSFLTLPILFAGDVEITNGTGAYAGAFNPYFTIPDANCEANGGSLDSAYVPENIVYGPDTGGGAKCGFLYGPRFNIVNEEEKSQLYANLTHEFSDTLSMMAELGWTHHEVLDNPQSPSYPNLTFPIVMPGTGGSPFDRPVKWYGRPLGAEADSPFAPRDSEAIRASLQLDGELNNGWSWMGALTYSENDRVARQPDTIASRLNAAIAGNGGTSGNETFNLFDPSANSQELIDWMSHLTYTNRKTEMTVADFVVSGELFDMAAGPVGFAAGAQWRDESYAVKRDDIYTQTNDPVTGDLIPVDLIFLGGGTPVDVSRDSYALFAEANLPLSDTLEASVAVRYENLSSDSSVDPKLSLRWQATDKLVLRASVSSAFREPSLVQLYNQGTSLQGLVDAGATSALFVRVNARGNTDLQPETSTNFNIGAVYDVTDDLTVRLDYWSFEYEDVITVENAQGKLNADPNGADILRDANNTLNGVNVQYINAETVDTDGIDLSIDWSKSTDMGDIGVSVAATRFLSYEIPCTGANARGCTGASGTQDVVGYFNYDNFARSMPETKVNVTADWTRNNHKVALMGFYTSSYETTRGGIPAGYSSSIDSWLTLDLQYAYSFEVGGTEAILTLGAKNLTDEDAPKLFDGANFSYDPKHHDPRGQIVYGRIKFAL
jgi:iron complex outermembrane receptor protein